MISSLERVVRNHSQRPAVAAPAFALGTIPISVMHEAYSPGTDDAPNLSPVCQLGQEPNLQILLLCRPFSRQMEIFVAQELQSIFRSSFSIEISLFLSLPVPCPFTESEHSCGWLMFKISSATFHCLSVPSAEYQ